MDDEKDRRVRALQELLASGVLTQAEYDEKMSFLQLSEKVASGQDASLENGANGTPRVLNRDDNSGFDASFIGAASQMSVDSEAPAAVGLQESKKSSSMLPAWAIAAIVGGILVVFIIAVLLARSGGAASSASTSFTSVSSTHYVTEANATFSVPDGFSKDGSFYKADDKSSAGKIYVSIDNPDIIDADDLAEGWFDDTSSSNSNSSSDAAKHSYQGEGKAYSGVHCIHYAYDTAENPEEFIVVFGDGDNNLYYIVLSGFEDSFYKDFVQSVSISGSGGTTSSDNSTRSSSFASRSSTTSSSSSGASFVSTLAGLGTFEPQTIEGSGDDVIDVPCAGKPCLMTFSNSGSRNFIVHSLNASGDSVDGLINEIGPYEGTVTDYERYKGVTQLEIRSSGNWSVTFAPMKNMVRATNGAQFDGDDVVCIDESGITKLSFTHDGESNFIVHAIGLKKSEGLVNEIGAYSGTKAWNESQSFLIVSADGNWTVGW